MIDVCSTSQYSEDEFYKHENTVEELKKEIKANLENAENEGNFILDNRAYPTSYVWRDIAQLALRMADEEDWFDRYFDKNSDYHN